MKIASFETGVVAIPRGEGPLGGGPGITTASFVTLKLRTEDGIEGIGYAGFASGVVTKALKEAVDGLTEQTIGADPMMIEAIGARLYVAGGGGAPAGLVTRAISAIDVALWDVKGKALGQPVYRLLGGFRDRVPTYASGFLWRPYTLDQLAETGADLVEQGFKAMKFRMGAEDSAAKEIARMRVLREAVGDDIDLMVDINQGWNVNQAISIGREMTNYNLFWLEDPVHHQDYSGMARIADALDTPIASGEYHYGIVPFRHMLEHRSIDIVMADLLRAGGLTGWMKIAHMAEAYNLPIVSHLATEVMAHAVAAAPNGLTIEHMPWTFQLFTEEPRVENGEMVMSDKPGLGVEFDEDALARYAAD
ncbi:MAG: mandelate racemase/muconate lactonizing enzyme family protein [SAR202 cluster bacterium]|nr:mandelate racemase/muconate lactonizing enzyme family protein [SAR202 cluster bacterium]MDP6662567.1 mandelate racemase/muconate lactonizing enzyme family protein [SAR202 cluster bacterium]MDP6800944.1 mandelate racemase/muconate lactonizing enzyme family protein [SAR202 cluster bacterium]|tara:strand:+ start:220 stop:1308 length:1089 start_codon:yes stop_codon:yes gene_type:complete